jgi:hypothetical protein
MFYVLALPFGGALAARLRHQQWQMWAIYGGCSILALVALWFYDSFDTAIGWTLVASVVGFLGPELWASCRGFMSHPRVFGWIAAAGTLIFLIYNQGLLGGILMIGLIFVAFRVMFRPLLKKGGGKK